MQAEKWLKQNGKDLSGKLVVLTGATGGLGRAMSRDILSLGGNLLILGRSQEKLKKLTASLLKDFPQGNIEYLVCDLNDLPRVKEVCEDLSHRPLDILMLNAGTYAIPREKSSAGFDTVFQINFLSHYYMVKQLLPILTERQGKVVATGSIAHRFNCADFSDPDFWNHQGANNIYGNSKRFLIYALMELLKNSGVSFAVGHPGISFTGITSNYPPRVLKIVKPSMLLLFMHPEKACLSIINAVLEDVPYLSWIGPRYFDIWGMPACRALDSCSPAEREKIYSAAEDMVKRV